MWNRGRVWAKQSKGTGGTADYHAFLFQLAVMPRSSGPHHERRSSSGIRELGNGREKLVNLQFGDRYGRSQMELNRKATLLVWSVHMMRCFLVSSRTLFMKICLRFYGNDLGDELAFSVAYCGVSLGISFQSSTAEKFLTASNGAVRAFSRGGLPIPSD
jgi:hypothetical protein